MTTDPATVTRPGLFELQLSTGVLIAAPPPAVWKVLAELDQYPSWNRAIPRAEGKLETGALLDVDIHWPGLQRGRYLLRMVSIQPQRTLAWQGRFKAPGLMDGHHRFDLHAQADGSTVLIQAERFVGLLVPLFAPWLRRNVLQGFVEMNTAIQQRAVGIVG